MSDQTAAAWCRYWPTEDVVLEFDVPVAAVSTDGPGRLTRTQYLRPGERFQYLPSMKASDNG